MTDKIKYSHTRRPTIPTCMFVVYRLLLVVTRIAKHQELRSIGIARVGSLEHRQVADHSQSSTLLSWENAVKLSMHDDNRT